MVRLKPDTAGELCRTPPETACYDARAGTILSGPARAGRHLRDWLFPAQQEGTVATDHDDQNGISRRDFASRLGAAAAGVALGGEFFRPALQAAPHVSGRILGANDKVVVASIGIRGQGNGVKRGFAQLANVEIKTLCDVDANLARRTHQRRAPEKRPHVQAGVRPGPAAGHGRQGRRRRHRRHPQSLARAGHRLGPSGRQARLRREAVVAHRVGRAADGRGGDPIQQGRAGRHEQPQQRRRSARRSSSSTTAASGRSTWPAASASSRGRRSASTRTARWRPARSSR